MNSVPAQTYLTCFTSVLKKKEEEEKQNFIRRQRNVRKHLSVMLCVETVVKRSLGTCVVEVQGGDWLPVKGASQGEVVDEP